ncbi:UvrD-helicase domain-containing protein [Hwanghaeella grinnelliae]|uniref:UvrD-helicase domain-containing protein n=1 Tax=Hwanghaeella grinnelliae TaxID=2500179 RepID=UPI00195FB35A|nr:UvrD-helicase domain-containing protein [Hwanghaeella grinnelliae]
MANKRKRRSALAGAILRPLGHLYWGLELTDAGIELLGGPGRRVAIAELASPAETKRFFGFSSVVLPLRDGTSLTVAGLGHSDTTSIIHDANEAFRHHILKVFAKDEAEIATVSEAVARLDSPRRYPSASLLAPFLERASHISTAFPERIPTGVLSVEQDAMLEALRALLHDPQKARGRAIERFIEAELENVRTFLDTIESNPLTPEQRLAVVTDEDATLVLAGAGSGKTSVIVGKAAYLIERGIRRPEEILLMAFGRDAAAEMVGRIKERSGADVEALTFHALGYEIIRKVEGSAPALAAHASDDAQFRKLLREILVEDIAKKWRLGGLLKDWFSEFYWPYKSEWDFKNKNAYYRYVEAHELRTLAGERVRSFEELEIANWLYVNGIEYEYEPVYEHPLPKNDRRAYTPDFRLKESGVYIEHFGIRKVRGPDGGIRLTTAPYIDHDRYLADMEWKRQVHREHSTVLVETFSYEQVEGRLTKGLGEKLEPYVTFSPIPEDSLLNTLSGMGQIDTFTQTLATFPRHFKGSGMTIEKCRSRSASAEDSKRAKAFLRLFEPLFETYQERLEGRIDFEDMIHRAAEHVEAGRFQSPYRHLLVDEFQDISEGRARLLRALKNQHADARIFAVGDDWQSIYRFAGSDIHLMRSFGQEFGGTFAGEENIHSTVDLGRTFRSVDKIALPARRFVLQNPSQIDKKVIPASDAKDPAISVTYYESGQDGDALRSTLQGLSTRLGEASVLLLGRYNFLRPRDFEQLTAAFPRLNLRFMTVHGSKGLEADHVVILRATNDLMGFPSEIVDDPLLNLVLPKPEKFDHAEERRLFYVALTRARKTVTILADRDQPSAFVEELLSKPEYQTIQRGAAVIAVHRCGACGGRMLADTSGYGHTSFHCEHKFLCGERLPPCSVCGQDLPIKVNPDADHLACACGAQYPACPEYGDGWLVERKGRHGRFLGCVNYPACKGTKPLPKPHARSGPT